MSRSSFGWPSSSTRVGGSAPTLKPQSNPVSVHPPTDRQRGQSFPSNLREQKQVRGLNDAGQVRAVPRRQGPGVGSPRYRGQRQEVRFDVSWRTSPLTASPLSPDKPGLTWVLRPATRSYPRLSCSWTRPASRSSLTSKPIKGNERSVGGRNRKRKRMIRRRPRRAFGSSSGWKRRPKGRRERRSSGSKTKSELETI